MHRVAGLDLHTEVVNGAALAGILDQHQLERWLGNGEVGVALLHLGRCGVEQLGVEGDRLLEVIDVEGELNAGHDVSSVPVRHISNQRADASMPPF